MIVSKKKARSSLFTHKHDKMSHFVSLDTNHKCILYFKGCQMLL